MRFLRCTQWLGVTAAIVVTVSVQGCATLPDRGRYLAQRSCEFIVYNQTPHALEIRIRAGAWSTTPIGALNPGELLTHSVACAERTVWIGGIAIPSQVGAAVQFGVVESRAEFVEGDRAEIALRWP